jgi:hypothetical protein
VQEEFEFRDTDVTRVVDTLERAGAAAWLNVQPGLDPDDLPPPRGIFGALFSARGPEVPVSTWVPGERSAGVQHGAGTRAAAQLADAGVGVPDGWRVIQDSPKRGLVVRVPEGVDTETVVRWLLAATRALCAVPITGDWLATVYKP